MNFLNLMILVHKEQNRLEKKWLIIFTSNKYAYTNYLIIHPIWILLIIMDIRRKQTNYWRSHKQPNNDTHYYYAYLPNRLLRHAFMLIQKLKLLNINPSFFINSLGPIFALSWLYAGPQHPYQQQKAARVFIRYIDDYLQLPLPDGIAPSTNQRFVRSSSKLMWRRSLLGPAML